MAENFEIYCQNSVYFTGKTAAVCLLCPSVVSTCGVASGDSPQVLAHFKKHHMMKEGFVYCNVCHKSICMIGQEEQLKLHLELVCHTNKVALAGETFRYCQTCGTVNPNYNHNGNHTIVHQPYIVGEGTQLGVEGSDKSRFANQCLSYIQRKNGDEVSIGAFCNEHFQKIFAIDLKHAPIAIREGGKKDCRVCVKIHAIWPRAVVRQANELFMPICTLTKYAVSNVKAEITRPEIVSLVDFAQLDPEIQELYTYDPAGKRFLIAKQQALKQEAKDLMKSCEDCVDGEVPDNDEELLN